jgi:hypothetical protein
MRILLFILLSFIGTSAFLSGLVLIVQPDGNLFNMSTGLLTNTPFTTFLIPGIILSVVVGGTNLLAVVSHLKQQRNRYNQSILAGCMICSWITVQMLLIGVLHWLHFLYLGLGIMIVLIAWQLKGKWAV